MVDHVQPVPLARAIDEYLDWLALDKARSVNIVRAYRTDLRGFLAWCAGNEGVCCTEL